MRTIDPKHSPGQFKMDPKVSIIIPCLNERDTIAQLLDAVLTQTYPVDTMEVVIADGGSTDGTLDIIADWQHNHDNLSIKLVENPKRIIPAALNSAIKASRGNIIIRLDAHSRPNANYIERTVASLEKGIAQNVGGVWDIQPGSDHWIARSIAAAAGHPIGVGGARYRYSDKAAYVDTVPFGGYKRDLFDQVGMFDETLLTNEDYEFNTRIRQSGRKIWFDPEIRSIYYARKDLRALARQYWRYGYWKWQMLRRYPDTLRPRQALPPLFILSIVILLFLSPFFSLAFNLFFCLISLYVVVLFLVGIQLALKINNMALVLGIPLAISCMHFTWGCGFLWGVLHPQNSNKRLK